MNILKTIIINILFLLSLLALLLLSPPVINSLYVNIFSEDTNNKIWPQTNLPNYIEEDWSKIHFREFNEITTSYFDYYLHRRNDYDGKTINIKNGIRYSFESEQLNREMGEFWFFGGSTIWGTGSRDSGTIPSMFAKKNSAKVINYGESGYIARQSLALLSNQYINDPDDNLQKTIIFYDGVNDINYRCRSDIKGVETPNEKILQNILSNAINDKWTFKRVFSQLQDLLQSIFRKIPSLNFVQNLDYVCSSDNAKAKYVASSLVNTWSQAQEIAYANGDKFLAVLQPVAFIGNPKVDHINLDSPLHTNLKREFNVVYPLINNLAKEKGINFISLINVLDKDEYFYIDHCHVSENGNYLIANEITKYVFND